MPLCNIDHAEQCAITATRTEIAVMIQHDLRGLRRGKYWAGLRSAFMPLFQSSSLAAYAPNVNAAAAKLASKCMEGTPDGDGRAAEAATPRESTSKPGSKPATRWTRSKGAANVVPDIVSAPFNITDAFADYAMEVVGSTAFG